MHSGATETLKGRMLAAEPYWYSAARLQKQAIPRLRLFRAVSAVDIIAQLPLHDLP
jgi:hypothetical protein